MPTNDERREVAENLRTMTMRGCRYKEEFYDLLNETVMNEWDFHSFGDVAERLADLIEPEPERTCEGHRCEETDEWVCHKCGGSLAGCMFDHVRDGFVCVPNFCPNCGAKVVE